MKITDNRQPEKQILGNVLFGLVFPWQPATDAGTEYFMVTDAGTRTDAVVCVNIETGVTETFDADILVKVLDAKVVIS